MYRLFQERLALQPIGAYVAEDTPEGVATLLAKTHHVALESYVPRPRTAKSKPKAQHVVEATYQPELDEVLVAYSGVQRTARVVDALWVLGELVSRHNYRLRQTRPTLLDLPGDIQRLIFGVSNPTIKAAHRVSKQIQERTGPLYVSSICKRGIQSNEAIAYILETNPQAFSIISPAKSGGDHYIELYSFTLESVARASKDVQDRYKSKTIGIYRYTATKYTHRPRGYSVGSTTTAMTSKANTITAKVRHQYTLPNSRLDPLTDREVLKRRASCVRLDPQAPNKVMRLLLESVYEGRTKKGTPGDTMIAYYRIYANMGVTPELASLRQEIDSTIDTILETDHTQLWPMLRRAYTMLEDYMDQHP